MTCLWIEKEAASQKFETPLLWPEVPLLSPATGPLDGKCEKTRAVLGLLEGPVFMGAMEGDCRNDDFAPACFGAVLKKIGATTGVFRVVLLILYPNNSKCKKK